MIGQPRQCRDRHGPTRPGWWLCLHPAPAGRRRPGVMEPAVAVQPILVQELLGPDAPLLPRRLFEVLGDGRLASAPSGQIRYGRLRLCLAARPVQEWDVIERVYADDPLVVKRGWERLSAVPQGQFRCRLRKLAQALNDRLTMRRVPLIVRRPWPRHLMLHDPADPAALVQARAEAAEIEVYRQDRAATETGALGLGKKRHLTAADRVVAARQRADRQARPDRKVPCHRNVAESRADTSGQVLPPGIAACEAFVRDALAKGPRPSAWLQAEWKRRGGRPSTLRRACKSLGIKRGYIGFGPGGNWWMALP
jgi:hypothetical protein